jgi:hypothetical protein
MGSKKMPLARYFLFVGGVLLALLFVSDAYLPKLPDAVRADADAPVTTIRIHSDRKWPERVMFDTSLPTIAPAQVARMEANVPAPVTVADGSSKVRVREAFAQLQLPDPKQPQPTDASKPEPKPEAKPQPKRRTAKRHVAPPMVLVSRQPQFGFFASNTW